LLRTTSSLTTPDEAESIYLSPDLKLEWKQVDVVADQTHLGFIGRVMARRSTEDGYDADSWNWALLLEGKECGGRIEALESLQARLSAKKLEYIALQSLKAVLK
jgi:hypothetical protein